MIAMQLNVNESKVHQSSNRRWIRQTDNSSAVPVSKHCTRLTLFAWKSSSNESPNSGLSVLQSEQSLRGLLQVALGTPDPDMLNDKLCTVP